jgi:hypothetical protein
LKYKSFDKAINCRVEHIPYYKYSKKYKDAETNLLDSGGAGGGGGDELLREGDDLLQVRLQLDQFLHRNIYSQKGHFLTFAQ